MRGGTVDERGIDFCAKGLSPRARGNPTIQGKLVVLNGSIPACAGEPSRENAGGIHTWVYPRVRGGTQAQWAMGNPRKGLSPRARGNPQYASFPYQIQRSIPACAGEPRQRRIVHRREKVYPRVRGGTRTAKTVSKAVAGLSPRARGNHPGWSLRFSRSRSIPACAGEPPQPHAQSVSPPVYPRVRGGTNRSDRVLTLCRGLSPRARGNRAWTSLTGNGRGSIPACAGEPKTRPLS